MTETIASILKGEPVWAALPAATSWKIRELLQRCLNKDTRQRLHDIADARLEIEAAPIPPSTVVSGIRRYSLLGIAACIVALFVVVALLERWPIRSPQPTPVPTVVKAVIKLQPGQWLGGVLHSTIDDRPTRIAMALSSDGRFIVYSAIEENPGPQARPQLYLRRFDQLEAKPIPGTEGAIHPFLSPDDRWVGFWENGFLNKKLIEGDSPATQICSAGNIIGASWHDSGIVFAGAGIGLSRILPDGGKPESLTTPDPKREESSHRLPRWLPDGRAVLFTVMRHGFDTQPWIAVLRLDSREWHPLLQNAADAKYVPTGHLVFLRQGTLMAVAFDLNKLQTIGQPFAVVKDVVQALEGITGNTNSGAGQWDISKEGSLVYAAGAPVPPRQNSLLWVDQQGNEKPVAPFKFPFFAPRLSPDGKRIAYATIGRDCQIWVYDLSAETNTRLTTEGRAMWPIWSPDGKRLVFSWHKSLERKLYVQAFDGSSPMERMTTREVSQTPGSWSRDGEHLAFLEAHPGTGYDIMVLESRTKRVSSFLNSKYRESYPELSPDGRWIAYCSDESKKIEVYVRPFPGPGGKWQISTNGGNHPLWSRNGRQLFYLSGDQVWVVDIQTESGISTSNRRMLFEKPGYNWGAPIRAYDLSLDGQRFLMVKLEQSKPSPITEMILVQNWFEELKRLVPTGKN